MARLALAAIPLMISSTPAGASSITGKVVEIHARASDGLHWAILSSTSSPRPACSASFRYYMIKDEHSDVGKSQFAMLLSAHLAGKTITVDGAGICTRWADGEDIDHVVVTGS